MQKRTPDQSSSWFASSSRSFRLSSSRQPERTREPDRYLESTDTARESIRGQMLHVRPLIRGCCASGTPAPVRGTETTHSPDNGAPRTKDPVRPKTRETADSLSLLPVWVSSAREEGLRTRSRKRSLGEIYEGSDGKAMTGHKEEEGDCGLRVCALLSARLVPGLVDVFLAVCSFPLAVPFASSQRRSETTSRFLVTGGSEWTSEMAAVMVPAKTSGPRVR